MPLTSLFSLPGGFLSSKCQKHIFSSQTTDHVGIYHLTDQKKAQYCITHGTKGSSWCFKEALIPQISGRRLSSVFLCALQKMEEAVAQAALEEHRRVETQIDMQNCYRLDLEREKMVTCPDCVGRGAWYVGFLKVEKGKAQMCHIDSIWTFSVISLLVFPYRKHKLKSKHDVSHDVESSLPWVSNAHLPVIALFQ